MAGVIASETVKNWLFWFFIAEQDVQKGKIFQ